MLITEYRIPLPLTIAEYAIGSPYTLVEMYKEETGGGEGVEILCNEPFVEFVHPFETVKKGQYTYKIYHLAQKVPPFIRKLSPHGKMELHEESWCTYPYCKTEKKLNIMNDGFTLNIQTIMFNDDRGDQENVHGLSYDLLKKRNIVFLDIVNEPSPDKSPYDLTKYKSVKANRGPFIGNWLETTEPIMTCYILITTEFKWFGTQTRLEKLIQSMEKRLFILYHRMLIGIMDKWYGLSIEEIRKIEKQGAIDLHKKRLQGQVQGLMVKE